MMPTRLPERELHQIQKRETIPLLFGRIQQLTTRSLVCSAYIHPFQGEALIQGHSSLISEIQHQLQSAGIPKPDALVCSVGGGGLLAGILQGMNANGWENGEMQPAQYHFSMG